MAGAAASDAHFPQAIDRVAVRSERLRTLGGVSRWSRRAVTLARDPAARFAWCDTLRPSAYPAHWAFRRTGLPYGIMVVGNDLLTLRPKLRRAGPKLAVLHRILDQAATFVAISHWTADRCRELLAAAGLAAAAARVRVIPLGTDPDALHYDASAAEAFRQRRGLAEGRWLLTVARLVDYKGIDAVIRIVASLAADYPTLRYAVVGRGPHEGELRELAGELGVADRVQFLTDVGDDELAAAYSFAELYVGLTRETALDVEGFGISYAEAAACGRPVIATCGGGVPDAVIDGETGVLVSQDDPAAATHAVRQLLDDPALAGRLGAAGRERVERYLNWERVVGEMRAVAAEFGRPR
jgi:phosphatidylinositol alpha-1,6-mannosyltransferase